MTSPAGSDPRRRPAGFSLVELLVVAAIMGLMAGAAALSLRGLRTPALSSAANEMASAVKMTRQMAIASGRTMYLAMPVRSNSLTPNAYRTYAILEEVKPGQEMRTPDAQGNYATNTNATSSWFIPQTDWRVLPEGAVISSLAGLQYSMSEGDGFAGLPLGALRERSTVATGAGNEWDNFAQFASLIVRNPSNPANEAVARTLDNVPFLAFLPSGRAFLRSGSTAGLTLLPGFTKGNSVAVTDTNSFFVIEVDSMVGRVRVRTPESYR